MFMDEENYIIPQNNTVVSSVITHRMMPGCTYNELPCPDWCSNHTNTAANSWHLIEILSDTSVL